MCKLKKTIYGLKQSPRTWFDKFSQIVIRAGFHRYAVNHSIFIKKSNNGNVILVVYVDDNLLTGSDTIGIVETKEHLRSHFAIKDMGKPRYFL